VVNESTEDLLSVGLFYRHVLCVVLLHHHVKHKSS